MARVNVQELEQAVLDLIPATGYITHADLIQQLEQAGKSQAATHILRLQQTGRIAPAVAKVPGAAPELRYSRADTGGNG